MKSRFAAFVTPVVATAISFLVGCSSSGTGGPAGGFHDPTQQGTGGGSSSGGGSSGSSGGGSSGGSTAAYPPGPYGIDMGQTVPRLSFQGYSKGSSTVGPIDLADYFDPDGTKCINALYIDEASTTCGICQQDAGQMESTLGGVWANLGVALVVLMIDGKTPDTALQWKQHYSLTDVAVGIDPQSSFFNPNVTIQLPLGVLVDPRTMKVIHRTDSTTLDPNGNLQIGGWPDNAVAPLAQQNAKSCH